MAFQVSDFNDLINLLKANPEWQSQLRNLLLSDDFLALPSIVRQLGERIDQLTMRMDERFAEIDRKFELIERRFDEIDRKFELIERRFDEIDRKFELIERRFDEIDRKFELIERRFAEIDRKFELIERRFAEIDRKFELIERRFDEIDRKFELIERRFDEIDRRFELIERRLDRLESDVGDLQGWRLEDHYQKNGAVYFGRLLKRSRILPKEVLADHLNEVLDDTEYKKAILIDVVVKGKLQTAQQTLQDIYLALEVSRTINPDDISRAWERARLISRAGTVTIPVVAGESIRDEVLSLAGDAKVVVHCGGQVYFWQEVLAQYSSLN